MLTVSNNSQKIASSQTANKGSSVGFGDGDDGMNDKMFRRWISPVETMLGSQLNDGNVIKANSIPLVPGQLQKTNKEAYKPKVVSIGPRHRGTNVDLQYMEDIKWKCMYRLLNSTQNQESIERLKKCGKAILNLDAAVRATYMAVDMDSYELAKIMLLDGCFLLKLLSVFIFDVKETDPPSVGFEKLQEVLGDGVKVEEVLSDLKLVENQIPLFIVDKLYETVLSSEPDKKESNQKLISHCGLSMLGCSHEEKDLCSLKRAHFVELTHSFLTRKENGDSENATKPEEEGENKGVTIPKNEHRRNMVIRVGKKDGNDDDGSSSNNNNQRTKKETKSKLKRCTARLEAAGVKIMAFPDPESTSGKESNMDNASVPFGCKFEWSNGELKIQSLYVSEETEVQWRNFIAWEQTRLADKQTQKTFSQYGLLFHGLVCCEYDVELLKRKGILKGHDGKEWNNEKLKKFIDDMTEGIQVEASADARFSDMVNHLNNVATYKRNGENNGADVESGFCHQMMDQLKGSDHNGNSCTIMMWHHYGIGCTSGRKMYRYLRETLVRDYTSTPWKTLGVVAAVVLLGLTIAQTVLAAISL